MAYSKYLDFLGHSFYSIPVFLIIIGLITASISFCGCCGAINEHHGLTSSYSWILGTLFLIELGIGIIVYNLHDQVRTRLGTTE